jgi:hypothetical protein
VSPNRRSWWSALPDFVRYGGIAGSVALGYLALYALLVQLGTWYLFAIMVAQVVAIVIAFPLYRSLVFGPGASLFRDFSRFMAIWSSGAVAGFIGTPALVESGLLPPLPAHVIAVAVVGALSFTGHRLISFRRSAAMGQQKEVSE